MRIWTLAIVPALAAGLLAAQPRPQPHRFAQTLVTQLAAQHPDVTEIGIELPGAHGCTTIASTDPGDVGETCESDDIQPLKTGRPAVAKESDGYDVSLLLHDASGRRVGVVGIEMKLAGHTRQSALAEARRIERTLAARIRSRQQLAAR